MPKLGIIGAGAWGTALAMTARRAESDVVLWAREPEVARQIRETGENTRFLPGIAVDPAIRAESDLEACARDADALLLVAPAQYLRPVAEQLRALAPPRTPLVICAKGIERATGYLMTEVLDEVLPDRPLAVLSGPTFAEEVARGCPAAATLAARDPELAERLAKALGSRAFRPYHSDDIIGAQIGGAVKNVIAIACGVVMGRRLGESARAALVTRGLAEIGRLAVAKGAHARTLMGLSALGDLALTCTGGASRNYSLGIALGEGRGKEEILGERVSVAEGVFSAEAVAQLAGQLGVEMPIVEAVHGILDRGADIDSTIEALLSRPLRAEAP